MNRIVMSKYQQQQNKRDKNGRTDVHNCAILYTMTHVTCFFFKVPVYVKNELIDHFKYTPAENQLTNR